MFGIMQQHLCKNDSSPHGTQYSYCGTCKSIGSLYGHTNRLFLNYDVSFLSSILYELSDSLRTNETYTSTSCWNLPKQSKISAVFKYTASLNVFLAQIKIIDNIHDSHYLNRLRWKTSRTVLRASFKKAEKPLQVNFSTGI